MRILATIGSFVLACGGILLSSGCSEIGGAFGPVMARVPAASDYRVGSTEYPPEEAADIDAFYISITEITQLLFFQVMGENHSVRRLESAPMENVTWIQAVQFCNEMSRQAGRDACYLEDSSRACGFVCDRSRNGYRLPTVAEWELACQGQSLTPLPWGNAHDPRYYVEPISENENARIDVSKESRTSPVATKEPWNGLYDMFGNVAELCEDPFDGQETYRTYKGGAWCDWGKHMKETFHVKFRAGVRIDEPWPFIGFRVVSREQ